MMKLKTGKQERKINERIDFLEKMNITDKSLARWQRKKEKTKITNRNKTKNSITGGQRAPGLESESCPQLPLGLELQNKWIGFFPQEGCRNLFEPEEPQIRTDCDGLRNPIEIKGEADLLHLPRAPDRTPEPGLWAQLLPSLHHCKQQGIHSQGRRREQLPCVPAWELAV